MLYLPRFRFFRLILIFITLFPSLDSIAANADKEFRLTILHTNDHHGRFWKNKDGEFGMSARKTLIDQIRKEVRAKGGHALLLSGGDINTGAPESNLLQAEPDFKAMRQLGYHAMAVGNHEFDNPLSVIRKQQAWAGFPFLSANIYYEGTNKRVFRSHVNYKVNGFKIVIVGFTTPDTPHLTVGENVKGLEFRDPAEEARKLLPLFKQRGADLVIAVTHMGHYQNASHGLEAPGDVTLARKTGRAMGLDLIVGGHSNSALFRPDIQNGTYIVQANQWGKYLGRIDLAQRNGRFEVVHHELIPVNLKEKNDAGEKVFIDKEIPEDKSMYTFLKPFQEKGSKELDKPIGVTDGKLLGRESSDYNESNLGRLIAAAHQYATNSDIGIVNTGGVRVDIEKGTFTYRDVLLTMPYPNTIVRAKMTATELLSYISTVAPYEGKPSANLYGLHVELNEDQTLKKVTHQPRSVVNGMILSQNDEVLYDKGKLFVDADRIFYVAMSNFLSGGGDRYPIPSQFEDTGIDDEKTVIDYLKALGGTIKTEDYQEKSIKR